MMNNSTIVPFQPEPCPGCGMAYVVNAAGPTPHNPEVCVARREARLDGMTHALRQVSEMITEDPKSFVWGLPQSVRDALLRELLPKDGRFPCACGAGVGPVGVLFPRCRRCT